MRLHLLRNCAVPAFALVLVASTVARAQLQFTRGDSNLDGRTDISDGVNILNILFLGASDPGCQDARDANDDGAADISDGVYVLNHLFTGGPAPLAPFGACGCDETEDALTCEVASQACVDLGPCDGAGCLDQDGLDVAIAENVPPVVCIAPDAAEIAAGDLLITVCPSGLDPASMCDGSPGCPVEFDEIRGTLDVDGRVVNTFVSGSITSMPLLVVNTALGSTVECSTDITFSGDAVIELVVEENESGDLVLVEILPPTFDRDSVDVDLSARGGILCILLAGFVDLFLDDLIDQLDAAAAELLIDLNLELGGRILCPAQ